MKTIEQIKGELMYMLLANGYEQYGSSVRVFNPRNDRSYDLDTIDGIAAMMPEGWKWQVGNYGAKDSEAAAWRESAVDRHGTFGPTPVESLTRLLHAVLSAQAARTEVGRG